MDLLTGLGIARALLPRLTAFAIVVAFVAVPRSAGALLWRVIDSRAAVITTQLEGAFHRMLVHDAERTRRPPVQPRRARHPAAAHSPGIQGL